MLCALALGMPFAAHAYQEYGVSNGRTTILLKWNQLPVHYYIENRSIAGVSAAQLQTAVAAAFATWQGVSTATLSSQFAGYTSAIPTDDDGLSTIGFLDGPEEPDVLGATDWLIDDQTGAIVESDIFFNTDVPWSVSASGQANQFDLQSIALHEIGHFWGLGHSALGETTQVSGGRKVTAIGAIMFPIALSPGNIKGRNLQPDDIAGISHLYSTSVFKAETGSVTGRVTKNGQPVFGAHVVAFSPSGGTMIGNFTDDNGNFTIAGLAPGPVVLRVEPIDDADLDSFFDDPSLVDVNFKITYNSSMIVVPTGGSSPSVVVKVTPK